MSPTRPALSLCMIVRNEAAMLPGCLDSVADLADEMIVVDTGSTDETPQIAKSRGARVFHREWRDDFAEARNASLAPARGEWILWLDADERLDPGEHCRVRRAMAAKGILAYLVPIVSATPTGTHVTHGHRLFRNDRRIRFSGRVHEQISPSISRSDGKIARADFSIVHLGYNLPVHRLQEKYERNRRLLDRAIAENPQDAYMRFSMAQTWLFLGDRESAEAELRIALGEDERNPIRSPLPSDIQASAQNNLAQCAFERGDYAEALSRAHRSLAIRPDQSTAHLMAYRACGAMGDDEGALRHLEEVERLRSRGVGSGSAIEILVDEADLRRAQAATCVRLGRLDEARRYLRLALERQPDDPRTLATLARCELAAGRLESALDSAAAASAAAPEDETLHDLVAFILLKMGRYAEAAERIALLCLRRPHDETLRRRLAGVLVKAGLAHEAAGVLASVEGRQEPRALSLEIPLAQYADGRGETR